MFTNIFMYIYIYICIHIYIIIINRWLETTVGSARKMPKSSFGTISWQQSHRLKCHELMQTLYPPPIWGLAYLQTFSRPVSDQVFLAAEFQASLHFGAPAAGGSIDFAYGRAAHADPKPGRAGTIAGTTCLNELRLLLLHCSASLLTPQLPHGAA